MNNYQKKTFWYWQWCLNGPSIHVMDAVQCDNEDEIDHLMNGFDTKFIAPEEIEFTDNPGHVSALTLETNVHVVDQGTTHTK